MLCSSLAPSVSSFSRASVSARPIWRRFWSRARLRPRRLSLVGWARCRVAVSRRSTLRSFLRAATIIFSGPAISSTCAARSVSCLVRAVKAFSAFVYISNSARWAAGTAVRALPLKRGRYLATMRVTSRLSSPTLRPSAPPRKFQPCTSST